mmetsp:Transcript_53985/g.153796  ORF Transcript_53985/g.153796 Transcript_53985/m.153796 type:complete len:225 (+) Transcript_53985:318-992(+)
MPRGRLSTRPRPAKRRRIPSATSPRSPRRLPTGTWTTASRTRRVCPSARAHARPRLLAGRPRPTGPSDSAAPASRTSPRLRWSVARRPAVRCRSWATWLLTRASTAPTVASPRAPTFRTPQRPWWSQTRPPARRGSSTSSPARITPAPSGRLSACRPTTWWPSATLSRSGTWTLATPRTSSTAPASPIWLRRWAGGRRASLLTFSRPMVSSRTPPARTQQLPSC